MKKSELKTGMIVKCRDGETALIVKDNVYGKDAVIFSEDNWTGLDDYGEDDLKWHFNGRNGSEIDIMAIFKPDLPTGFLTRESKFSALKLLWERKEEKPILTLDGVEYSASTLRSLLKKAVL